MRSLCLTITSIGAFLATLLLFARPLGAQSASTATITGLTTEDTSVSPVTQTVSGAGTSGYPSANTYDILYQGITTGITGFSAGSTTYEPLNYVGTISTTLVRNTNNNTLGNSPNNNLLWSRQVSVVGSTVTVAGPYIGDEQTAFNANNLNVGTDNLFGNTGDGNGNNNNVERVDVVFHQGLVATATLGFAVLERGGTNAHDPFKIAAITGIDVNGVPTSFGALIGLGSGSSFGSYGTSDLVSSTNWLVSRNEPANTGALADNPSTTVTNQAIGGVVVSVTESTANNGLGVNLADTIYGYALFGNDVTSAMTLTDVTSFPQNTSSTTGAGGIDLVAYTGVAFNATPVPEPGAVIFFSVAGLVCLLRRGARRP